MDTSAAARREVPMFYGYIKDSSAERAGTFALLILLASFHNLSRTIGTSLLFCVSPVLTLGIILGEFVVYHSVKFVRDDYICYIQGLQGSIKWVVSFFVHTISKILVDYTGFVHDARGPKLCGGSTFVVLTVVSQALPFASLYIYHNADVENRLGTSLLLAAFLFLFCMWLVCVVLFKKLVKREYRATFWGSQTAKQFTVACFLNSDEHFAKMMTAFDNHESFIETIRDEVKRYVLDHWETFLGEEWFSVKFQAQIPAWFKPTVECE